MTAPATKFPAIVVTSPKFATIIADVMANHARDAFLKGQLTDSSRLVVLAATLDACSSLGFDQVRAILAQPRKAATKQPAKQPAAKAFLDYLQLCSSTDLRQTRRALRMYVREECECLGPPPPGAAAEVLERGSRFLFLKEGAAFRFSVGDLAVALHGYATALRVMMAGWGGAVTLPPQQRAACAREISKVNANMSLIALQQGKLRTRLSTPPTPLRPSRRGLRGTRGAARRPRRCAATRRPAPRTPSPPSSIPPPPSVGSRRTRSCSWRAMRRRRSSSSRSSRCRQERMRPAAAPLRLPVKRRALRADDARGRRRRRGGGAAVGARPRRRRRRRRRCCRARRCRRLRPGGRRAADARRAAGLAGTHMAPTADGDDVAQHQREFGILHAALPPRLPAARAPADLGARARRAIKAPLPPDATPCAVRAHFAYAADAAEVRAALEADARMLRVWRVTLRPVGPWLARNRWGYLAPLAALSTVFAAWYERTDGVVANPLTLAAHLLLRGEAWGGGAAAQAAFERAVGGVDGLAELFAGYYAMLRNYSYALPQLDAWTQEHPPTRTPFELM
ncbi:hypothetical protein JKP88DRAFT_339954 [Tribonema minus]|uniref:Uncharacterized protein n=1 Tax=Tribonema minus TaxID=303371 RepID=A0A835YJV3_9STRA|nr:hypothetical protein JKP88DRAFT_339954 [Tribonema minus]